jgi:hypothetical protein
MLKISYFQSEPDSYNTDGIAVSAMKKGAASNQFEFKFVFNM